MAAFERHCRADRLTASRENPRLVGTTRRHQHDVKRVEVGNMRHRHQMVTPEITTFPLNAALLMAFTRRAEFRGKPPMRAERHEPHSLLAPVAAQDLAHRTGQVVVAQQMKYPAEVGEGMLVPFQ